jgi:hypothetical protein
MKSIWVITVIFLTSSAYAEDPVPFFPPLGEFFPRLETAVDSGVCRPSDLGDSTHSFKTPVLLSKIVSPHLQNIQFADSDGAIRLKVKLGDEYNAAFAIVMASITGGDVARTFSALVAFQVASYAKVSTAKEFAVVYRKFLEPPRTKEAGG